MASFRIPFFPLPCSCPNAASAEPPPPKTASKTRKLAPFIAEAASATPMLSTPPLAASTQIPSPADPRLAASASKPTPPPSAPPKWRPPRLTAK